MPCHKGGHGHGDRATHGHGHGGAPCGHQAQAQAQAPFSLLSGDMNMGAIALHSAGDAASSLLVAAVGLTILHYPDAGWARYLDPVAATGLALLIGSTAWALCKQCAVLLMDGAPTTGYDAAATRAALLRVAGVAAVGKMHVWSLDSGDHLVCVAQLEATAGLAARTGSGAGSWAQAHKDAVAVLARCCAGVPERNVEVTVQLVEPSEATGGAHA